MFKSNQDLTIAFDYCKTSVCFVWHNEVGTLDFSVQINANKTCHSSSSRKTFLSSLSGLFLSQPSRISPHDSSFMKPFSASSLLLLLLLKITPILSLNSFGLPIIASNFVHAVMAALIRLFWYCLYIFLSPWLDDEIPKVRSPGLFIFISLPLHLFID